MTTEKGSYVVPGALGPVEVNGELDRGVYTEANVWAHHPLSAQGGRPDAD